MGLRPAKCYKKVGRPYTRQSKKKPRRSYVKGIPSPKIVRFEQGNKKKEFSKKLVLVSTDKVQIRHNALEAARIAANKILNDGLGAEGYFLKILVYPHNIMRENPLATGAGADRFQTGMRKSFGHPIGMSAIVKENQKLIEVRVDSDKEMIAKKALKVAGSKFPIKCIIQSN